jgi:hypothetical protein
VSHSWQPQVITKFGEHKVSDLLRPPKDADMLRAGGHLKEYTPPSERAMSTERPDFQMGGELQTHWGGYAEPMSYNPHMPGTGETVMFRGKTHEDGGIGITYGDNPVEVERGEPMFEMQEGGEIDPLTGEPKKSGVVLGNMKIPSYGVSELEDANAKGKKFKTYVAHLSKKEAKQNKIAEKATSLISNIEGDNPYDMLKMNAGMAMLTGADMSLKNIADKKRTAAGIQSAILDTAEQMGVDSDALAKGKIKQAKKGANISKGQTGVYVPTASNLMSEMEKRSIINTGRTTIEQLYNAGLTGLPPNAYTDEDFYKIGKNNMVGESPMKTLDEVTIVGKKPKAPTPLASTNQKRTASPVPQTKISKKVDEGRPTETRKQLSVVDLGLDRFNKSFLTPKISPEIEARTKARLAIPEIEQPAEKEGMLDYVKTAYNELRPFLIPSNQMSLQPEQLMGEMYALSQNVLQPVRAQTFQPLLETRAPQMTAQEQLNKNQADFNSAQRMIGNNPAALSMLAAQKQAADRQAIAQTQAANIQQQMAAANRNIALLNDATIRNLATLDAQYVRQETAESTTKAQAQAALNSIASKIGQNKLQNLQNAVMQNMYNYRFTPKGRVYNVNPIADFNLPQITALSPETKEAIKQQAPELAKYLKLDEKKGKAKNGSLVKAIKNL